MPPVQLEHPGLPEHLGRLERQEPSVRLGRKRPELLEHPEHPGQLEHLELYAALVEGRLAGVACINTAESPEYDPLPWTTARPAVVIHRMAVDPACQRGGVGSAFFRFAEDEARRLGLKAMRLDTYSLNHRMQALIRKMGFTQVGEIHLHGRPLTYPCFEKDLRKDVGA